MQTQLELRARRFRSRLGYPLKKLGGLGGWRVGAPVQRHPELLAHFVRVMHGQIVGWRISTINGARQLTQLRISECVLEPDGPFGEKVVERIRVLEPGSWTLFQKTTVTETGSSAYLRLGGGSQTIDGSGTILSTCNSMLPSASRIGCPVFTSFGRVFSETDARWTSPGTLSDVSTKSWPGRN